MKKVFSILLTVFLLTGIITSCSDIGTNIDNDKFNIVCTIFPAYDWVREIIGDNADKANITMLLDSGVDLHSYQPTVDDIINISNCDMFVYVGGESDFWVDSVLKQAVNKDMIVINMLDVLGNSVKEQEIIEGMVDDHDHSHSHNDEIKESDIKIRQLSDFNGEFVSIFKYFEDGTLDDYLNERVGEKTFDEIKQEFLDKRTSEYATIEINGDTLTVHAESDIYTGNYIYSRYIPSVNADGDITNVWYGYELAEPNDNMPTYLLFSDHGYGAEHDEDDHDEVKHFHLRYGDESLDALMENTVWTPTFYDSHASDEEIKEAVIGHDHSHSHDHEHEFDEHVWLSLRNAALLTSHIAGQLDKLDSDNSDTYYQTNAETYITKLAELDNKYNQTIKEANYKTLLFADRFPFRYLVDDYGLSYYAAFSGCSAETEASFETVAFLARKTDELNLKSVITIEGTVHKIAETVINNTKNKNQAVVTLDSMQSTTSNDVKNGVTYLSIMEKNLEALKTALN